MAIADIQRVGARVVWVIGARDGASQDFVFDVDDDRFSIDEIITAIIETEAEMVRWFAESYHPQRIPFLQWVPEYGLASGDVIPEHLGQIEAVRIDSGAESEEDWMHGQPTTLTNIRLWRENPSIFPNADGYYHLSNQTLEFTGETAQVNVVVYDPEYGGESEDEHWVLERTFQGAALIQQGEPINYLTGFTFEPDDVGRRIIVMANPLLGGVNPAIDSIITSVELGSFHTEDNAVGEADNVIAMIFANKGMFTAKLQISDIWESALVSGAVAKLAKLGVPPSLVMHHSNEFSKCEAQVRQGLVYKPEVNIAQKIG